MRKTNKDEFLKNSEAALGEMFDMLTNLPALEMQGLTGKNTALVIVDMINGFAREGALKSPRVEALIDEITRLSQVCDEQGMAKLAFADCHTEASPEFGSYPVHCLTGTSEGQMVKEIEAVGGYKLIPKNSTNGFLEEEFQTWLGENLHIDTYIVTGDCTDICVLQFATTLKTWFNRQNKKVRIIVPANMVDTYDLGVHNGDLMHAVALYMMIGSGIEVVKEIKG